MISDFSFEKSGAQTVTGDKIMKNPKVRYHWSLIVVHWAITVLFFVSMAVGWYQARLVQGTDRWKEIFPLHVSLGVATAVLTLLLFGLRLIHKAPPYPPRFSLAQIVVASVINWLLYITIFLAAISGYLQAVYSGRKLILGSIGLPQWGQADPVLSNIFADIHVFSVFALSGLVLIHVLIVFVYAQFEHGFMQRMLPGTSASEQPLVPVEDSSPLATRRRWLARSYIFFGWAGFGLQLSIAILSLLILLFASSGSMVSPDMAGIELGIFWANCAIGVLVLSALLSIYFTRIGKKLGCAESAQAHFKLVVSMRFLKLGILLTLVGILLALLGTGMSITVFISKVVSQPPGIAITDPQRIIRALDVFVLLANVNVIAGHVFATFIWLWLFWRAYSYQTEITEQALAAAETLKKENTFSIHQ